MFVVDNLLEFPIDFRGWIEERGKGKQNNNFIYKK